MGGDLRHISLVSWLRAGPSCASGGGWGEGSGEGGSKSLRFASLHEKAPERGLRRPPTSDSGSGFSEPGPSLALEAPGSGGGLGWLQAGLAISVAV